MTRESGNNNHQLLEEFSYASLTLIFFINLFFIEINHDNSHFATDMKMNIVATDTTPISAM